MRDRVEPEAHSHSLHVHTEIATAAEASPSVVQIHFQTKKSSKFSSLQE